MAHDYDYPEFIPTEQNHAGSSPTPQLSNYQDSAYTASISDFYEIGSSENYFSLSNPSDEYDYHSNQAALKESCRSDGYLNPVLNLNTIEMANYPEAGAPEAGRDAATGNHESRDKHAQKRRVENKRLSTRFFPRIFTNEKNYPNAARAPNQRISQWLSSAACGLKKYGGFVNPTHQPGYNSGN